MPPLEDAVYRFLDAVETVFHELEAQNWGNYELLLDRYKELCAALGREPIV